jgi:amidase
MCSTLKPFWKDVVAQKRAIRDSAVKKYLPKSDSPSLALTANEILPYTDEKVKQITATSELSVLQKRLGDGTWTAEQVTSAYIQRAAAVHEATNCFTEVLFDEALESARRLDEYFRKNGHVIGPFHGIPITVKDQFDIKGVDTTLGYVGRAGSPAVEEAAVVKIFREQGAVFLGKTNLPQSIMVRARNSRSSPLMYAFESYLHSGVKRKILCGDLPLILAMQLLPREVLREARVPCSQLLVQ